MPPINGSSMGISMVQPPGNAFEAALAMALLSFWPCCHMDTLMSGFDFEHGVHYECSVVSIALKCTTVELGAWDTQIDGQIAVLLL